MVASPLARGSNRIQPRARRHGAEALARAALAGAALLAGAIVVACVSSSSNVLPDAGGRDDASPAGSGGGVDASRVDGAASGSDGGDPFEGVWQGLQLGATVEITNAGGCSFFTSAVNGTVCDECTGTYVIGDAGAASVVAQCLPRGTCSVSPPHTDTGTFTITDGGAISFVYDYGFGTSTFEAERTQRSGGDVCDRVDAGLHD